MTTALKTMRENTAGGFAFELWFRLASPVWSAWLSIRRNPWGSLSSQKTTLSASLGLLGVLNGVILVACPEKPLKEARSTQFVGDASCIKCHSSQGAAYEKTAHRLTLQLPSPTSVLGSFTSPKNSLRTLDPKTSILGDSLTFKMTRSGIYFYETAIHADIDDSLSQVKLRTRKERIDLVTGSGVRGQSYLYWKGDGLFELPISFWTDGGQWINSPDYPDGSEIFDRPIYPRCLECHTTFIQPVSEDPHSNRYIVSSLVSGITCERCHGPGQQHAELEASTSEHDQVHDAAILNPKQLSRERQIDLCALCHNGAKRLAIRPTFSFKAGDNLDDFFAQDPDAPIAQPDVHGNQVALLKRSRCFQSSETMTCSTCHNEHAPERPADEYSSRCLICHQIASCGLYKSRGESLRDRCVRCHMPMQPTTAIVSRTNGRFVRARMRTHWIKVYN